MPFTYCRSSGMCWPSDEILYQLHMMFWIVCIKVIQHLRVCMTFRWIIYNLELAKSDRQWKCDQKQRSCHEQKSVPVLFNLRISDYKIRNYIMIMAECGDYWLTSRVLYFIERAYRGRPQLNSLAQMCECVGFDSDACCLANEMVFFFSSFLFHFIFKIRYLLLNGWMIDTVFK